MKTPECSELPAQHPLCQVDSHLKYNISLAHCYNPVSLQSLAHILILLERKLQMPPPELTGFPLVESKY